MRSHDCRRASEPGHPGSRRRASSHLNRLARSRDVAWSKLWRGLQKYQPPASAPGFASARKVGNGLADPTRARREERSHGGTVETRKSAGRFGRTYGLCIAGTTGARKVRSIVHAPQDHARLFSFPRIAQDLFVDRVDSSEPGGCETGTDDRNGTPGQMPSYDPERARLRTSRVPVPTREASASQNHARPGSSGWL